MTKIKTYEAMFNPEHVKGVFGISLVENPAMQGKFIALSEDDKAQTIQLKTLDEEKRILIGLVLEPNKPVYRNNDGEEYYLTFSERTVEELSHHFFKANFHKNSTLEHADKITGVTFVESWIVADPKNDKSAAVGLSHPKGSWVATMKVDSDEVWNNYVKTGKVLGFSVDAIIGLREVNLKTDIEMSNEKDKISIADALKEGFTNVINFFADKQVNVDLGAIKAANEDVDIQFEGETLEIDGRVWILAEDNSEVPLPAGEYPLEDGRTLVVAEVGVVSEIKDPQAPAQPNVPAATETADLTAEQAAAVSKGVENTIKSIMIKYDEQAKKQNETIAALEQKLTQFAAQPAVRRTPSTPRSAEPTSRKQRILETIENQK